jgi:hypothetical protein
MRWDCPNCRNFLVTVGGDKDVPVEIVEHINRLNAECPVCGYRPINRRIYISTSHIQRRTGWHKIAPFFWIVLTMFAVGKLVLQFNGSASWFAHRFQTLLRNPTIMWILALAYDVQAMTHLFWMLYFVGNVLFGIISLQHRSQSGLARATKFILAASIITGFLVCGRSLTAFVLITGVFIFTLRLATKSAFLSKLTDEE